MGFARNWIRLPGLIPQSRLNPVGQIDPETDMY